MFEEIICNKPSNTNSSACQVTKRTYNYT